MQLALANKTAAVLQQLLEQRLPLTSPDHDSDCEMISKEFTCSLSCRSRSRVDDRHIQQCYIKHSVVLHQSAQGILQSSHLEKSCFQLEFQSGH